MSDKVCSKCHGNPATSNGYCASCNAERMTIRRTPADKPDSYALAMQLGMNVSVENCMFVDALTDTQALFLLERLYGKEEAHKRIAELMQQ